MICEIKRSGLYFITFNLLICLEIVSVEWANFIIFTSHPRNDLELLDNKNLVFVLLFSKVRAITFCLWQNMKTVIWMPIWKMRWFFTRNGVNIEGGGGFDIIKENKATVYIIKTMYELHSWQHNLFNGLNCSSRLRAAEDEL